MQFYKELYYLLSEEDDRGRLKTRYPVTLTRIDPKIEVSSKNIPEWIYQILSEKDKKEIASLAKEVLEGKITESDFKKKVEGFFWDKKNIELSAGRIMSLIKTDPKYTDISFDEVEEGKAYQIKKEIKPGPGGYVITDKEAPKDYIELTVDVKEKSAEERRGAEQKVKKKDYSTITVNPEGLKSSYKEGSVHEIEFNTLSYSRSTRKTYKIYRKISENEYVDLKRNHNRKVVVFIDPTEEQEHKRDLYYITIPRKRYGERVGSPITYTVYLIKKAFDGLSSEEKDKLKIRLVPLEDIRDGISTIPLNTIGVSDYLKDKPEKLKKYNFQYSKKVKDSEEDAEPEALDIDLSFLVSGDMSGFDQEVPEEEDVKAAKTFLKLDGDLLYAKMIRLYTTKKQAAEEKNKQKEKEYDEYLIKAVKDFNNLIFEKLKEKSQRSALITKVLKDKLTSDKKLGLYNNIKPAYDNMESLNESILNEQTSTYLLKTVPGSKLDQLFSRSKTSKPHKDENKKEIPGEYIVALDQTQVNNLQRASSIEAGFKSINPYTEPKKSKEPAEKEPEAKKQAIKDEGPLYRVKLKVGGKTSDAQLSAKQILGFTKNSTEAGNLTFDDLETKVYDFEKKVDPKLGSNIKGSIEILSKNPVGKGDKRKVLTTFRADTEREKAAAEKKATKEKEKQERDAEKAAKAAIKAAQPEMKTVRWMGRDIKVPANYSKDVLKIPMATPTNADLIYKYYLVDTSSTEDFPNGRLMRDSDGNPIGTDDRAEARAVADRMGGNIKVYQKAELSVKKVELKEDLSKEDEAKLKTQISFVIESDPNDLDKVAQVTGNAVKAVFNKEKNELVITLDDNSQAIFTGTKSGNVTGVYNPDINDKFGSPRKINDIKEPLKGVLDRVFPTPAAESKLEAYIRKRIKEALQEAELGQYIGVQGPEVKKKRLEEYMKKYEWGFQNSEDPYVRSNGSQKHAIVSKLVHELGDEGVAIFNSYAPKGQEIARPDDLNDMADSPLGSQMARPFEPNTLTMRGGRVAEASEQEIDSMFDDNVPMDQQLKNAEELASDYMRDRTLSKGIQKNPNLGHVEKTIVKFIQKASEKGARKDIDPKSKILQALQVISDRQMNKYR